MIDSSYSEDAICHIVYSFLSMTDMTTVFQFLTCPGKVWRHSSKAVWSDVYLQVDADANRFLVHYYGKGVFVAQVNMNTKLSWHSYTYLLQYDKLMTEEKESTEEWQLGIFFILRGAIKKTS